MRRALRYALVMALFLTMGHCWAAPPPAQPIVIAHRGASGYLPEHTLEAYAMAHAMGADFIEPDLVLTKDKHFICLHDIHLEATTDVEQRFPNRTRRDGRWYAADFTLLEIKQLRVHERLPKRFPVGHAQFNVPTFEEMIELIQGLNKVTGKNTGIYPELKAPTWHTAETLPMERAFLEILKNYGYVGRKARVFVQCFEPGPLKLIRGSLKSRLPLILLLDTGTAQAGLLTDKGLAEIAKYANGIGPSKLLIEANPGLVEAAHAHKLLVHPYTFRADMLPKQYKSLDEEFAQFFGGYKVDGLFTDFPDQAAKHLNNAKD